MSLLPNYIISQLKHGKSSGIIEDAYAMFLDISGFTTITESLMKHDDEGIEAISDILNALFSPVIDIIDRHNGFIAQFAGDAVTAVFHQSNRESVIQCSFSILSFIKNLQIETSIGVFSTAAKIGIAEGEIHWGICGHDNKAYYFRGNAIDNAAKAESYAKSNDIILNTSEMPERDIYKYRSLKNNMYLINSISKRITCSRRMGFLNNYEAEKYFFPLDKIPEKYSGEFRNIVSIFLSFPEYEYGMMNLTIDHILTILHQWGGYLSSIDFGDKGAKAVIFFGMPHSYENNVRRSLGFLTDIRSEFGNIIRAGISYGKCYSGMIGDSKRATYTAIGDKVNIAARLMGLSKKGQILVDSNVYKQMKNYYAFECAGNKKLKGKRSSEKVYIAGDEKKYIKSQTQTDFTGRLQEKNELFRLITSVLETEETGLVSVISEPGQGKTRLIEHVLMSVNGDIPVIRMKAEDIIKKSYNSVIDMMERVLELPDDMEEKKNKFREQYGELIRNLLKHRQGDAERYESILAALLGIFWEDSIYEKLDSSEIEQMIHQSIVLFIECMSSGSIPIIFIDDFQWIDSDTEKFMHYIMNESAISVCLVIGCRTEQKSMLEAFACPQHIIELNAMTEENTQFMSESILSGCISEEFSQFIHKKSGGNPFYTEQFVKYLNENNMLIRRRDMFSIKDNVKGISLKLGTVISSRIDSLSTRLKRAVFAASVLGSEFRSDYVKQMLIGIYNITNNEIDISMDDGISRNIWQISSELKYLFTHILLRETAYSMMLKKDLRNLHYRAAQIIIDISGDDKRMNPDIAYHFEQSSKYDESYIYYEKAGDYYELLYNYEEAIKYYHKCIIIAKKHFEKGDLRLGKAYLNYGMSVKETGRYRDALKPLNRAAELLKGKRKGGQDREDALNVLGACYWNLGQYNKALNFHRKAMAKCISMRGLYHKETAATYNDIGMVYWSWGKYKYAYRNIVKALKIRKALSEMNNEDIADSYNSLGTLFLQMSKYSESLEYLRQSIEILENTIGHEHHKTGIGYNNIGVTYFYLHDYDKAIDALKSSLAIFDKLYSEKHPSTALTISNIGGLYNKTGDLKKAKEYISKSLELFREIYGDEHPNVALSYNNLGKLNHSLGKHVLAKKYHQKALNIRINALGDKHYDTGLSLREVAHCLIDEEQYADAEEYLKRAISIFRNIGGEEHIDIGITAEIYSKLLIRQGRYDEANIMLSRALNAFRFNNDREGIDDVEKILSEIKEE